MIPTVGEAVAATAALIVDRLHGHGVYVGRELALASTIGTGGVPLAVCLALAVGGETITMHLIYDL